MKYFTTIIIAIAAGGVSSQQLSDFIPECAVGCLTTAIGTATTCDATDLKCVCIADNYRNTYTAGLSCVLQTCGSDVAVGEVLPDAANMCAVVAGTSSVPAPTSAPVASTTNIPASTTGTTSSPITTSFTAATTTTAPSVSTTTGAAPSVTSSPGTSGSNIISASFAVLFPIVLAIVVLA